MTNRIVEISNPVRLSLRKKQLVLKDSDGKELASIPIEDMAMLILNHPAITFSQALISECSEQKVGLVITDSKHMPAMILQPLDTHSLHTKILREQLQASLPRKKQIWQMIVRAKISEQVKVLKAFGRSHQSLEPMIERVRSGDVENIEAQAARRYWRELFGDGFRRDADSDGINGFLNYGYAVMRAAVARAVVASGLHPALSVHHSSQYNAFCLADDLMEPLRPRVDLHTAAMPDIWLGVKDLTPEIKRYILDILTQEVNFCGSSYPLLVALERYVASYRTFLCDETPAKIEFPLL